MRHSRISRLHGRRSFTLCRHQAVAHFGLAFLPVGAADATTNSQIPVIWAIGMPADGQIEQLGIWRQLPDKDADWSLVLGDLWIRGVERIGWAVTSDVTVPASVRLPLRPRIGFWRSADSAPSVASPNSIGLGKLAVAADQLARTTQTHLAQSVRRHGLFKSDEAAVAFVAARLDRLDFCSARVR